MNSISGEYSVPIVVPEDPTVEKELTEKSQAIVDVFLSLARQSNVKGLCFVACSVSYSLFFKFSCEQIPSEGDIVKGMMSLYQLLENSVV